MGRFPQELPASDKRLEDQIAQVGVVVDEFLEGVRRHLVHLASAAGIAADQGGPTAELGQVAGKIPRPVDDDCLGGVAGLVHDVDLTGNEDVEPRIALAGAK